LKVLINLKTAKELGLTVAAAALAQLPEAESAGSALWQRNT
jgi:hypothetical protein